MFVEKKEYSKPQFDLVVINSVDIITASENDNSENDNNLGDGAFQFNNA